MRLIEILPQGDFRLSRKLFDKATPRYAILSHTWGDESEEVTYEDMVKGTGRDKAGFKKIDFCGKQAERDGLRHFWVDSCCIKKSSDAELSESLNSMFRWYRRAVKCYVYLSDVTATDDDWEQGFRKSRWFTRGWTLQELLAPTSLEFFAQDRRLGDRQSLLQQVHEITDIPSPALHGATLFQYTSDKVFAWARYRQTLRDEDWAYSLLGILGISMPIIYGEGRLNATRRLKREVDDISKFPRVLHTANHHGLIGPMSTLVEETRGTFLSEDITLQRHLAHVYADLAGQRIQLRRLSRIVEGYRRCQDEPVTCLRCGEVQAKTCGKQCAKTKLSDLTTAGIFIDCVSRFSGYKNLSISINGLSTSFAGNPAYTLERNTSFYPEMYATEGLFTDPLFVLAIKQSDSNNQPTQHYYLLYAKTPRTWHWVIVSATFVDVQDNSALLKASSSGINDFVCRVLPKDVASVLRNELPHLQLYPSVTKINLFLDERKAVQSASLLRIESTEDNLESEMVQEDELLHEIEVIGCQIFRESSVEVLYRRSSACFTVKLNGQTCIERKRPFTYAEWDDEAGLSDFMDDLKLFNSLQACHGVARFLGVVVDDLGLRLRSYLSEAPMTDSLHRMFYIANFRCETIPWSIRELWAKQIAQAMADIHSKGLTIGVLDRDSIGLRANGSAILHHITNKQRVAYDDELISPELSVPSGDAPQHLYNDRTDIYQLGRFLWLLAEHRGNTRGLRCSRNACTNIPRYRCTTDHANPTHLPPNSVGVAPYFSKIITQCRSPCPKERPTARLISDLLSIQCQVKECSAELLASLKTLNDDTPFGVHCSECGDWASDVDFHCYVCHAGNFDLCAECVAQGIRCLVSGHVLVERRATKEGFIHVS